jgi:hypothetical protein
MINKKIKLVASAITLLIFSYALSASADVDEVTLGASSAWASWYWPVLDTKNPNMYDDGESMARYDDYDLPIGQGAQEWESLPENHGDFPGAEEWQGHCHGWGAAAIWEPQPTYAETHSGVEFRREQISNPDDKTQQ